MKILVAEDEPSILLQYQIMLQARGHEVMATDNGMACLETYKVELKAGGDVLSLPSRRAPYDVVILDYRMPKLDGLATAREILRLCPLQRIVFASAYVAETLRESTKDLHQIVELLQKPFSLDYLVEIIEDIEVYQQLAALNVKVKDLKNHNLSLSELVDLLAGVRKLHAMVASSR